MGIRLVIF